MDERDYKIRELRALLERMEDANKRQIRMILDAESRIRVLEGVIEEERKQLWCKHKTGKASRNCSICIEINDHNEVLALILSKVRGVLG